MFIVRCPKCRNSMLYQPKGEIKNKKCVYCGCTFSVKKRIVKRI